MSTPELRTELRRLIDERIPAGMTAADTRFSDPELDILLAGVSHINSAAASGWRIKASRAMSERGGLEKSSAGDEKHEFVSIEVYRDHCLEMAKLYDGLVWRSGTRALEYHFTNVPGVSQ